MNKKIFLIFVTMIANQAFATDLTGNSASCDSGVLGVEYGGVALKADYSPETIELRWYDDTGKQIAVTSEYASCTYNEPITIPTAPTKTGYKFAGWKVRPKYDFSTFNPIGGETNYAYGRGFNPVNNIDDCHGAGTATDSTCNENFDDLGRYQWKGIMTYGVIYGVSLCSNVYNQRFKTGNPTDDTGQYCWCKVTAYRNGNTWYSPSENLPWVVAVEPTAYTTTNQCLQSCARECASEIIWGTDLFRRPAFGQSN